MQLRYLKEIELHKASRVKQSNGTYINTYTLQDKYMVEFQELTDEVSASVYGTTINKMYRISSPYHKLENTLKSKVNETDDNISLYTIKYNSSYYKISAVRNSWVDIEYKES